MVHVSMTLNSRPGPKPFGGGLRGSPANTVTCSGMVAVAHGTPPPAAARRHVLQCNARLLTQRRAGASEMAGTARIALARSARAGAQQRSAAKRAGVPSLASTATARATARATAHASAPR